MNIMQMRRGMGVDGNEWIYTAAKKWKLNPDKILTAYEEWSDVRKSLTDDPIKPIIETGLRRTYVTLPVTATQIQYIESGFTAPSSAGQWMVDGAGTLAVKPVNVKSYGNATNVIIKGLTAWTDKMVVQIARTSPSGGNITFPNSWSNGAFWCNFQMWYAQFKTAYNEGTPPAVFCVPFKRNNVVGFYDLVAGAFYTPSAATWTYGYIDLTT